MIGRKSSIGILSLIVFSTLEEDPENKMKPKWNQIPIPVNVEENKSQDLGFFFNATASMQGSTIFLVLKMTNLVANLWGVCETSPSIHSSKDFLQG